MTIGTTWAMLCQMKKASKPVLRGSARQIPTQHECDSCGKVLDALRLDDLWVEQDLTSEWRVALRLVSEHGRPVVGEARVFPIESRTQGPGRWSAEEKGSKAAAPAGGLPTEILRRVKLGIAHETFPAVMRYQARHLKDDPFDIMGLDSIGISRAAVDSPKRPGRRGQSDLFYAELARDYVALVENGERAPVQELAARRHYSPGTVSLQIYDARHARGVLSESPRGKAGGHLTMYGRRLLLEGEHANE